VGVVVGLRVLMSSVEPGVLVKVPCASPSMLV